MNKTPVLVTFAGRINWTSVTCNFKMIETFEKSTVFGNLFRSFIEFFYFLYHFAFYLVEQAIKVRRHAWVAK